MSNTYLFQGNPRYFDIDTYLSTHPYVYWRCPSYRYDIQIGDVAIMWRAGKDAGMIAIGEIFEPPTPTSSIKFPELLGRRFWASHNADLDDIRVGISISDVSLSPSERSVSRENLKKNSIVNSHRIITNPVGTVFRVEDAIANEMLAAWGSGGDLDENRDKITPDKISDWEGNHCYVLHKRRERSSALRKLKVKDFLSKNDFIYCELCGENLNDKYPRSLSEGYIEVHHVKPISTLSEQTPTYIDDLILLCPNCHRMVHRSKEAEKNLEDLRRWFAYS